MQHTPHGHRHPPEPAHRAPNWYATLSEILASELGLRLPDCEFLFDRLAAKAEHLP